MEKLLTILLLCGLSINLYSQDIITKKDGEEINAKVLEVGNMEVKYKKFENQEGPIYSLPKSEIFMIKYQNGEKDIFTQSSTATNNPSNTAKLNQNQPLLSMRNSFWSGVKVLDSNGNDLNSTEVRQIMANVPNALHTYNSGKTLKVVGTVFGVIETSCLIIGILSYPYNYNSYNTYDYSWLGWTVTGLVFMIPAIILDNIGNAKIKSAVTIYNNARNNNPAISLNFGITPSGIGMTLRF